ncbi:MAG TPA: HD-GYP domain-containing protein, partial [Ardenticatenaceae bacterium]|nr:HD-GYP domain-containing protein [Ardenticatenaceae bacterium]
GAAGILAGELVEHKARRSLPGESAAAVGRATIVVLLGATLAQTTTAEGITRVIWLVAAAVVMLAADVVTRAIALLAPERPFQVIVATASDTVVIEGVQYLLGILGVLAALHHPSALLFLIFPIGIVYLAFKNVKESRDSTRALLESMADAVDLRDPYTGGHSRRVANLCRAILREMGISGPESELILAAARVHDIGKIGVPDEILKKPGPLTPQERAIMNEHAERGALFLARYRDFAKGVTIVRYHHERWDGKGYPHGLKGVAIPFGARVIAVADCFDAMTSHRPYRRAMTPAEAVAILEADRGQQWDPVIVEAFIRYFARELDAPAAPGGETAVGRIESREPLETAV